MEYHKARYYIGTVCTHCGSTNTMADIYRYSIEGWCLSCTREFTLTTEQKAYAKGMANDSSIRTTEPRIKVSAVPPTPEVQGPSPRGGYVKFEDHGNRPGTGVAR